MAKAIVIYGSTTGTCEDLANRIAGKLGAEAVNVTDFTADKVADCDLVVIGSSTWGDGDVQDDWYDGMETLKGCDLSGKKVAIFGCGDKDSYPDSFCGSIEKLHEAASATGAQIVGEQDGFHGLALDEVNSPDATDAKIDAWTAAIA